MREGRRVPIRSLIRRLHVTEFDRPAPLRDVTLSPARLTLPLRQSAGAPCVPRVRPGERVHAGQVIGEPPEGALGALLHAPVQATVRTVTDQEIVLEP
ncbi:MAG: hypothetical protein KatS3mg132_580 [Limisphaera sp.]|nr:MAG: hypothetical protein KatS3mg132_580 [Limisphaera sp.]